MSCQELKKVVIGSGESAQHSFFFVVSSNIVLKLFNLRFIIIIIIIFYYYFFYSGINQKGLLLTVCSREVV